jgi:protein-arginine kinase activator protein McsA
MTIKSAPYYWVQCDGCKKTATYMDEYSAWSRESEAIDHAIEDEWTTDGEKHHCSECPTLTECKNCKKSAGELAGERDDHCQTCWDAFEAEEKKALAS